MALNLAGKKQVVSEVAAAAAEAHSAIAAEYRGLGVDALTDLRNKARQDGVYVRVVKNSLAKRALEGTEFECMRDGLVGPMILAFSQEAPGSAARLLRDFGKDNDKLEVVALSLGGKALEASHLEMIAKLPTRDEAISKLMFVMKAPTEQFVRTLAEPTAKFVRTLAAVRDQMQ